MLKDGEEFMKEMVATHLVEGALAVVPPLGENGRGDVIVTVAQTDGTVAPVTA